MTSDLTPLKLESSSGESKKKNVDRSYTRPEIKTILDICDVRMKAVSHYFSIHRDKKGSVTSVKVIALREERRRTKPEGIQVYYIREHSVKNILLSVARKQQVT